MELLGSMDPYIKLTLVETEKMIKESMPDADEDAMRNAIGATFLRLFATFFATFCDFLRLFPIRFQFSRRFSRCF